MNFISKELLLFKAGTQENTFSWVCVLSWITPYSKPALAIKGPCLSLPDELRPFLCFLSCSPQVARVGSEMRGCSLLRGECLSHRSHSGWHSGLLQEAVERFCVWNSASRDRQSSCWVGAYSSTFQRCLSMLRMFSSLKIIVTNKRKLLLKQTLWPFVLLQLF